VLRRRAFDAVSTPARLVVSAAGTGAGKTLVTLALCAALRDAGFRIRAYKTGPDYIDARLYACVLGAPAHNLDLWLDGEAGVQRHVHATAGDADILIIEGMMGLFDGDDEGATSTAMLARTLDATVLTVLDTWTASQSAAAIALGLRAYDPAIRHAGVILNRVGGTSHATAVQAACARAHIEVLAAIPTRDEYRFPERTLGLDRVAFAARAAAVEQLAAELATQLDLPALVAAASSTTLPAMPPVRRTSQRARVAYAEDAAFWFTYPETLDALRDAGAELVPFSPLHDCDLPRDIGALWIGGGYPEDHADALEANAAMRSALRDAVAGGMPAYAECGGLMYLAETLHTASGSHVMVGAIPGATSIAEPRLHLGYRLATVATTSPLDAVNSPVRGYEFHYASSMLAPKSPAYKVGDTTDGAVHNNCMAAFLHRHFLPGDPAIDRFVTAAAAFS
jgi:cobyrinic acid a,c-diamide synthase